VHTFSFSPNPVILACQISVLAAWWLFAVAFLFRKRPSGKRGTAGPKDRRGLAGALLQGIGFAFVWFFSRPSSAPLFPVGVPVNMAIMLGAPVLAFLCVWLMVKAIRTLGRQWALNARLLEDHALVTEGPFARMRHPIYSGMLGMLIATGAVFAEAWGLGFGAAFFAAGLAVRIRAEEKLLAAKFGPPFEEYRRAVPAILPSLFRTR
jgi:protein-S-isoprenylcysteine O-methyltransferase Ste14